MQRTFHLIEITSLRTLDGNNQSLLWENRCNLSECAISTIGSWIWTDPELIAISYMPEICRWLEGKFRGGHLLHPFPADNLLALPVTLSQIELSQFHHLGTSQIHTSAAIRMSLWIMLPERPSHIKGLEYLLIQILSHPLANCPFYHMSSQNTVGRGIAECTAWLHRNRLCHHIFLIIRCADARTSVRIHQKCLTKATGHAEQMFQLNLLQIWIRI